MIRRGDTKSMKPERGLGTKGYEIRKRKYKRKGFFERENGINW